MHDQAQNVLGVPILISNKAKKHRNGQKLLILPQNYSNMHDTAIMVLRVPASISERAKMHYETIHN